MDQANVRAYCLLVLLCLGGCGGGNSLTLAPVTGTVTHEGQKLSHGRVVFSPTAGTRSPQAIGEIEADGQFVMHTTNRPGVVPGDFIVTVHCRELLTPEEEREARAKLEVPPSMIDERYSDGSETPLRAKVTQEGLHYDISLE